MAACRLVVSGALRKLGKLAAGREPRTQEATDALEALRGLYQSLITSGALGRLHDVVPTTSYTAGENQRILRRDAAVATISLPELVDDVYPSGFIPPYGARWVPPSTPLSNKRPPRDGSVVVINDAVTGASQQWIYDGHTNEWQAVHSLTLDSPAPLSERDLTGLQAMLAVQIADEYGGDIPAVTGNQADRFRSALVNRWSMPRRESYGTYT